MSDTSIRFSDLISMWHHSMVLMDIAANETSSSEYAKIVDHLNSIIDIMQDSINKGNDLQLLVDGGGFVKAGSATYSTDLSEDQIAAIKRFGVF